GEIAMASPSANGVGQIAIFFGRSTWPAGPIDTSTADILINGTDTSSSFGANISFTGVADLDGDGSAELFVPVSNAKKVYLFRGSELLKDLVPSIQKVMTTANASETFSDPAGSVFGTFLAVSNIDGVRRNLFIADSPIGKISYYAKNSAAGVVFDPTRQVFAVGPNSLGTALRSADLNGDGLDDLCSGSTTIAPALGTIVCFWSGLGMPTSPSGLIGGVTSYGSSMNVGDVVHDGQIDLLIGEPSNGNGRVELRY
ncbi:MAG: VCBS repeat-containing protein, partial [Kiritimatiellia bacterium]|nr:VCBS repeat-containing protein [Kiritimatiellia bacterium]